jgi:hypothetical protein
LATAAEHNAGALMARPGSFCKRRNELADNLVEVSVKLSIAAAQMADIAGTSTDPRFANAKMEVERLRDECESIKSELAHHRLQHGC